MGASETVSALSDLLNSGNVTALQAAERAEEIGVHLPYGTIAAYWSGSHGRPSARTLKALAQVVPFTEERLQRAAWNATEVLGPWVPPEESALLDKATRKALSALIKSVVAAKGSQDVVEATPESDAQAEGDQVEEVEPLHVILMKSGHMQGQSLIISQADLETAPADVKYEILQTLPLGTQIDLPGDGEPVRMVIQVYEKDGETPDGPPRAVTRTQFERDVPLGTKVDVLWPKAGPPPIGDPDTERHRGEKGSDDDDAEETGT